MAKLSKEQRLLWDNLKYSYDNSWIPRTNPEMLEALKISRRLGRIIPPFANSMMWIAKRYVNRKFYNKHGMEQDMIAEAMFQMLKGAWKFNPNKSNNIFAYLVTITNSAMIRVVHKENKEKNIQRDLLDQARENNDSEQ